MWSGLVAAISSASCDWTAPKEMPAGREKLRPILVESENALAASEFHKKLSAEG
jgi:hypothetical protein